MSEVHARLLNGDEEIIGGCQTINDICVHMAALRDIFAPDVTVLSIDHAVMLADDEPPPLNVYVVINEEPYDDTHWRAALVMHAKAQDRRGVLRAMTKLEQAGYGSGEMFCGKVLCYLVTFAKFVKTDADSVTTLLDCRADTSYADEPFATTALIHAAMQGQAHFVRLLSAARADVNQVDQHGRTAFTYAVDAIYFDIMAQAAVNHQTASISDARRRGRTDISHAYAVNEDYADITQVLIAAQCDIDHRDENETALIAAARRGRTEMAHLLLSAGAARHHADGSDFTALMYAVIRNDTDMTHMLITARADVNQATPEYKTVLHFAAEHGHVETAQLLIAAGSDIHHADDDNRTALIVAAEFGNAATAQMLINAGARVDDADSAGHAALIHAARHDHADIAQILVTARADVNREDAEGETALSLAMRYRSVNVMQLLSTSSAVDVD